MTMDGSLPEKVTALSREAAEWRMISLLLDCPSEAWRKEVAELSGEITNEDLKKAGELAAKEGSEGVFHSIFGPGGPAPGREISYRPWVQPGYMISEISAYFDAFAFHPRTGEAPDHVCVETAFISYLKMKEAFAVLQGDEESAGITSKAASEFCSEHLVKIAEPLAKSLSESGVEYLSIAAKTLLERTGRNEAANQRAVLPVLSDVQDDLFECGSDS